MKKRFLAILLAATMAVGLMPAALAENGGEEIADPQPHWADSAVAALNGIYGENAFFASDEPMTEGDTFSAIKSMGASSANVTEDSTTVLTRSAACDVLAEVFLLPVPDGAEAIDYLYSKNIVNGYPDGSLGKENPVTKAQFAVLTYRTLNSVGGGKGSATALKPGTKEYSSWMFLAMRNCTNGIVIKNEDGEDIPLPADSIEQPMDKTTLSKWADILDKDGTLNLRELEFANDTTKLQAAVEIVQKHLPSNQVFKDVPPSSPFYPGVMYLFDRGIVMGYGGDRIGEFGVDDKSTRMHFAVLLHRISPGYQQPEDPSKNPELGIAYVTDPNHRYMTPPAGVDNSKWYEPSSWWSENITREEAIVAILKQQGKEAEAAKANTEILRRFADGAEASVNDKYLAYAVSIGLLSGRYDEDTDNVYLDRNVKLTRGMLGVLLYRTLLGLDTTKMQDYRDTVSYVLGPAEGGAEK